MNWCYIQYTNLISAVSLSFKWKNCKLITVIGINKMLLENQTAAKDALPLSFKK